MFDDQPCFPSDRLSSRRSWLCGCAAAGAAALSQSVVGAESADDPDGSSQSPDELLARLYRGNHRFVTEKPMAAHRDLKRVKTIATRQNPFAAFLGCADSRVPIEIVFDQGFGDLFVTRIAGNIASSENVGSLEFGTQILGARVLYVLGHTNCGAVTAAMKGDEVPGQISGLFQYIRPAVKSSRGNLDTAVRDNVRNQAIVLAESSPVISKLIRRKELLVAGGVYDLQTGLVTPVEISL